MATVFDVSDLLVLAEVDETDIALVKPGQKAQVELDAFPEARSRPRCAGSRSP